MNEKLLQCLSSNCHLIINAKTQLFAFLIPLPMSCLTVDLFVNNPFLRMNQKFNTENKKRAATHRHSGVAHVVNKVFAKVSKKISKVSKRLGCYAFSFIVCAFSSSSSFLRFVYCASYALICDVIFKPPFYLPYSPFLKRKSDQNKIPADPPLVSV